MVFKSVFARYLVTFVTIILLSFFILAVILSAIMQTYNEQMTRDDLSLAANSVSDLIEDEVRGTDVDLTEYILNDYEDIQSRISSVTRYMNELYVFITDVEGTVLILSDTAPDGYCKKDVSKDIVLQVFSEGHMDFNGTLSGVFDRPHYVCAVPITVSQGQKEGMVVACRNSDYAVSYVTKMIKTVMVVSMWVMIAAIIASYFISERVAKPLREMSKAAKEFAAGHFDVRVPVRGNDEISQLAIAFNNMASDMKTLEMTRSTFLANVSHDLRTPMTTIGGFVDAMLSGAIPKDKYDHYLEIIGNEVRRLARLVSSLLDISRIQAGERKFNMQSFDICELARQTLFSFEQKIDAKALDVEFDCDQDNMFVIADRDAIYQIVYNICDNGIKFSREGGKYRIEIHEIEKKIHFSVYNEGIGIPEEDLPYVFERFYKADKSRGIDKTGVGLGMYISRTIIEAHGERIWVESVLNEYCRFTFTLKKDSSKNSHDHRKNK